MKRIRSILSKLDKRYVVCSLAVWAALGVLASFTGHWPTEENPYRSYALQACAWLEGRLDLGQDYPWLELAIVDGRYFVSFPPFPSFVLLPLAAVFGANTPDHWVSLAFTTLGTVYAVRLYRETTGTYKKAELYALFLMMGNGYLFIALQGGWVWYMAQTMGFALSLMALFYAARHCAGRAFLCLACAFGCRPMVVVYAPLILLLTLRGEGVKAFIRRGCRLIPACLLVLAYMALNAARFGNPLEFGHSYLPEFVRAEEGQFSLSYAAKHFAQLLRLPKAGGEHGMLVYDPYDCMAFWLIAPMTISFFAAWLAALAGRRKGRALELFALPLMLAAHLMIICCHRTLGGYQFGNRYIVDMLPYVFYGLLSLKTEKGADWIIPLFALGFSVNLIGTVAAYNHWI